jgi:tripartite-type tricarboxylate transporter receptor subunit TctC
MRPLQRLAVAVVAASLAWSSSAWTSSYAIDYPTRPVRIIVGFAAGSSVDLPARLLAQRFTEELGRPFVVENRGGAGGNLAAEAVARGSKDGHTLLLATNAIANAAAMGASYDPVKDFAPIITIATGPQMLVAGPSLNIDNLAQLITLARQHPDRITYAGGTGLTMTGLAGVLLNSMADIKLRHIPYPGSAPGLVDLLAGRVDLLFAPALAVMSHVEKGELKALATSLPRAPASRPMCRPWRRPECRDTSSACGMGWSVRRECRGKRSTCCRASPTKRSSPTTS